MLDFLNFWDLFGDEFMGMSKGKALALMLLGAGILIVGLYMFTIGWGGLGLYVVIFAAMVIAANIMLYLDVGPGGRESRVERPEPKDEYEGLYGTRFR